MNRSLFPLVRHGKAAAWIAVPPGAALRDLARQIQHAVLERWRTVLPVRDPDSRPPGGLHCIALGCMADHVVIRGLYLRGLTLVDHWYPGAGGYVLQTVMAPGNSGRHVLVVGGAGAGNLAPAVRMLIRKIRGEKEPALPWMLEVRLGRGHRNLPVDRMDVLGGSCSVIHDHETTHPPPRYRSGYRGGSIENHLLRLPLYGPNSDNGFLCRSSQLGLRYLYTGRTSDGARYRKTFLDEIRRGVTAKLYHYKSAGMFTIWEALAAAPVFRDADRDMILGALRDYLSGEAQQAVLLRLRQAATGKGLFGRHLACDALNHGLGGDLLHRLTGEKGWLAGCALADAYFRSYRGQTVPATGLTEGYASHLDVYLAWMQRRAPDRIAEDPEVRLWAERVLALCAPRGLLLPGPQTDRARYPYHLLRRLAWLLQDGRYLYGAYLRHRQVAAGNDRLLQFVEGQACAAGIEPREPTDHAGLRIFPACDRHRRALAARLEPARAFDRIVGRSGWRLDDEYLAFVGIRGIGKTLPNTGALACYERFGTNLLTTPSAMLLSQENNPWSYPVLSITVDGLGPRSPPAVRLENRRSLPGIEIVRYSAMLGSFCRWVRTVVWRPRGFLLVIDRAEIKQGEAFTIASTLRTAAPMKLMGPMAYARISRTGRRPFHLYVETTADFAWSYSPTAGRDSWQEDLSAFEKPGKDCALQIMAGGRPAARPVVVLGWLAHATPGRQPVWRLRHEGRDWLVCGRRETWRGTDLDGTGPPVMRPRRHAPRPAGISVSTEPAKVPVPRARPLPPTRDIWRLPSCRNPSVTVSAANADAMAVGARDGRVIVVGPGGQRRWEGAPGPTAVTALCFSGPDVIAGHRCGTIIRYDRQGRLRWRSLCRFRPERAFWPWWFLDTPRIGALAAGQDAHTKKDYLAAGTGSCALNIFEAETGRLVADVISPYGLADRITAGKDPVSGALRFYVGHAALSAMSGVRAWPSPAEEAPPRNYIRRPGPGGRHPGWDLTGVPAFRVAVLEPGSAARLVLLRAGMYNQLCVYDLATADPLWAVDLGGCPLELAIHTNPGKSATLYTLERYGWLTAFDAGGKSLWSRHVGQAAQGLALTRQGQVVIWRDGCMMTCDRFSTRSNDTGDGRALAWHRLGRDEGLLVAEPRGLAWKGLPHG